MKFLKNFFFIVPYFLKNSFIFLINPRNKKLLEIFSASKCAYLELSTGKIKNLRVFLVNTPRVNFCISMALAFKSSVGRSNLKILKNHYHRVKLQQKWLKKNTTKKKTFLKMLHPTAKPRAFGISLIPLFSSSNIFLRSKTKRNLRNTTTKSQNNQWLLTLKRRGQGNFALPCRYCPRYFKCFRNKKCPAVTFNILVIGILLQCYFR